ncbi:hypothetical protein B5P44_00585 [Mycobacterium sp. CBMA 213]|uniref:Uncharacterized protein n=1 Tax=Mycolicibacterium sp. CBMA 213 TaxID=1968788 RepID=A0A343VRA0_9MYCO|nr:MULTISPECIES: hypothetical protein [unclassified Mycolicibacterium]AVN58424.1 hypothetical protein B5P44_p00129 [Mycolicibacterium sp. CBMA 213]MUL61082.1 hypothetical protein [Mycolicibacterium sp. CBMA 335]MUM03320.1 hypothetical protein [Mycolicibacterium sp. CBMA 213]
MTMAKYTARAAYNGRGTTHLFTTTPEPHRFRGRTIMSTSWALCGVIAGSTYSAGTPVDTMPTDDTTNPCPKCAKAGAR